MAHATLGPSSAERWMSCPGSIALSLDRPKTSNDAADEGTAYHAVASTCLEFGMPAASFVGKTARVWEIKATGEDDVAFDLEPLPVGATERRKYNIDAENAAYVQQYIDYCNTVAHGNMFHVEQSVPIDHLTEEDGAEGTADFVVINTAQQELVIVDLKFGRGVPVFAENNSQLMKYALGALRKFADDCVTTTDIRLVIVQPRCGDGRPQEWIISREDLEAFGEKVKRAASRVWAAIDLYHEIQDAGMGVDTEIFQSWADSNLLVTEKGCQFCPAKAKCPRIAKDVAAATEAEFENLDQVALPVVLAELPDKHPNQDLANKMAKTDLIEGWCKAVRAEVERALIAGEEVPGYKLVQGKKGNREWMDDMVVETLLKKMRIKNEDMYKMTLHTPTKIETFFKAAPQPKRWLKLKAMITQKDGALSVAHESDKRDAVSVKPTDDGMVDLDDVSDLI